MTESARRPFIKQALRAAASAAVALGTARAARSESSAAAAGGATPDWQEIRRSFALAAGHAYLNTATLGAAPRHALDEVARGYQLLAADPETARTDLYGRVERSVRPALARLLGADPDEIALTSSASESLYLISNGIALEPGDEVVTTNQDHPAGIDPWTVRAERSGIAVRQVSIPSPFTSGGQVVDLFREALSARTRVLSFCHVTRGGHLFPVKELCALARDRGIVSAVDGAQALGMLEVVLHGLGCDLYAGSPHKWLLAPSGNGMLYVRRKAQARLVSLFERPGAGGRDARRYEHVGTYALPVRVALGAALELFEQIGIREIERRNRALSDYLKAGLESIRGVRRISLTSREVSSAGITLFEIEGIKAMEFQARALQKHRIHVDEHVRNGHDAVRVSTHFYNSRAEIDLLLEILRHEIRRS